MSRITVWYGIRIVSVYYSQSKEIFLGDIAISPQFCKDESFKLGINFKNHLKFIVVHAILHLLGFDHKSDKDAAVMNIMQDKLMLGDTSNALWKINKFWEEIFR